MPPSAPPVAPTGWTLTGLPAAGAAAAATPPPFPVQNAAPGAAGAGGLGAAPRGRILVVEGGYGSSGRRTWGRGGPAQAPVLSAMLAAVSPQVLLAADAVDAVHLPGAGDPHTVLAHLRAASRHPGPLLIHLGGHIVADKRGGQLQLTLRDAKQDGLPWQAVAAELSHRPAEWQTLVIADLSADQNAWPYLQGTVSPLSEGIPLWAVVSPDPEQIGTFTRALIEALHGGRPGAGEVLAPEQLRQQVYSVLRPDVVILATHAPDRPFFRNTARRGEGSPTEAAPAPVAPLPRPAEPRDAVPERPVAAPAAVEPAGVAPSVAPAGPPVVAGGPVSLVKPGVPATPRRARPVSLLKAGGSEEAPGVTLLKTAPAGDVPEGGAPLAGVSLRKGRPEPTEDAAAGPELPQEQPAVDDEGVGAAEAAEGVGAAAAESAARVEEKTDGGAGEEAVAEAPEGAEEPGDAAPAYGVPSGEEPADEVPAGAVPAEEPTAAEAPTGEEPAAEVPTDLVPREEAPAADAPVGEAPAAAAPSDEPPAVAEADGAAAAAPPRADYREVIGRIVRSADAGDHAAATDLAFALELEAIAEHGAVSEPVLQVRQVRAHVCRLAGRSAEAADIYREVALTLLRSQGPDHVETQRAATNAEACWRAITDRAEAIRIAPEIIELRAYLPGPDGRKLRAAERYLAQLAATG
ncbi:hypothetical protein [Kitasatospora sp. NPDC018619]|uniref:hypothetical protein n=1 Tax=unclassified Kitasatospora TaxID=2633591 RepID=UPI0037B1B150